MKKQIQLILSAIFMASFYFAGYGQITIDNFTLDNDVVGTQFIADNGIVYEITSPAGGFQRIGVAKIVSYSGSGENVIIPGLMSIRHIIGYSVVAIEIDAFRSKGLEGHLEIANSVREVGDYAFFNNQLTSVKISNTMTEIGISVFDRNQLKSVDIPSSVTNIKRWAFSNNPDLTLVRMESNTPPTLDADVFVNPNHNQIDLAVPNGAINAYENPSNGWADFRNIIPKSFTSNYTTYEIIETRPNKEVAITNYDTAGGSRVNIPETVNDGPNTYEVTAIGDGAFKEKGLTEVTIPDGVTAIGEVAFQLNLLRSVVIPNSVISIGSRAFQRNHLTEVTIGENVTSIETHVFQDNRLSNVVIPNSAKIIHRLAFKGNSLTEVTIGENVTRIENNAFEDNRLRSVDIPNGVTSIGEHAFQNNQLTSVTLGENVTEIRRDAFAFNQLRHLEIPNSVTSIEQNAFQGNQLESLDIPGSVTSIGIGAFVINQLKSVVIPNSVTRIEAAVFSHNQLTEVTIPDGVADIGSNAFNNNQLERITIPNSVTSIENNAFSNNLKLHTVQVEATTPPVLEGSAFFETDESLAFLRDLRSEIHLVVPKEAIDAYKASDDWKGFRSISDSSTPPQPTIGDVPQGVDNMEPFTVNITFDGEVTGFELGDIEVTNATASTLTGSGPTYTATLVPTSLCSDITIDVPTGAATGVNNLPNLAATQVSVSVVDTVAPIITCPADVVANTADNGTGDCTTTVDLGRPVTDDNCSVASIVAQVNGTEIDPDTYAFSTGTTTVTWIVRDGTGNIASCEQTVTVHDDEAPMAMAKDITVQLNANGQVTISPEDVDNGSGSGCNNTGPVSLSLDRDTFTCDDVGTVTVVLTATQGSETATATATVTVEESLDNLVAMAKNITVQLDANGQVTISPEDVDDGSSYGCGSIPELSLDRDNFTCDDVGNPVPVTLTATQGNQTATATALVTVEESLGNLVAMAKDITVQLDASGQVTISPDDMDDGSGRSGCNNTSDPIFISLDKTTFSCGDVGTVTVMLTATQGSETATATATVTVEAYLSDLEAMAKDITVQLDADGQVTISPEDVDGGSAYDGCGSTPELSLDIDTFDCDDVGTPVTVTLTATHGTNTATATATVTLEAGGNCELGPLADFNRGFSPNGDGIGDTLVIEGLEHYRNNVVKIYDLSQRLLFSAHYGGPEDAWDGTQRGGDRVPVGSYVCVIDYKEPGLGHEAKMIYVNY